MLKLVRPYTFIGLAIVILIVGPPGSTPPRRLA
jgi:hypothetical protein